MLPRGGGGSDPTCVSQLDKHPADAAAGAVHQHRLAGSEREPVEQLPRGRAGQRNRGGLGHTKRRRAVSNPTGIELCVSGVCPPAQAAYPAG